jgi:hypothetical protein
MSRGFAAWDSSRKGNGCSVGREKRSRTQAEFVGQTFGDSSGVEEECDVGGETLSNLQRL